MFPEKSADKDATVKGSPPLKADDDTTVKISPGGPPPKSGKGQKAVKEPVEWTLAPKGYLKISMGKGLDMAKVGNDYMIRKK
jgi:hypothetical protein